MKKKSGEISSKILIGGGIVLFLIIIFLIVSNLTKKPPPPPKETEKKEELVYEIVVGDVKFKLVEAKERGNTLKVSESVYPERVREDLVTTDRFIEVTISAENVGKDNIPPYSWDIEELVDKEERKFYSPPETSPWIPKESKCGALLKPGFTPTLCTKIYEVANVAKDLKVKVTVKGVGIGKGGEGFINLGF
jgi:hypothetical protein